MPGSCQPHMTHEGLQCQEPEASLMLELRVAAFPTTGLGLSGLPCQKLISGKNQIVITGRFLPGTPPPPRPAWPGLAPREFTCS